MLCAYSSQTFTHSAKTVLSVYNQNSFVILFLKLKREAKEKCISAKFEEKFEDCPFQADFRSLRQLGIMSEGKCPYQNLD